MSKVLLFGLGDLAAHILHFLARNPNCPELVVCSLHEEQGRAKVNTALVGASYSGPVPAITYKQIDLRDIDRTAELLKRENPDVIINCAAMQTWHAVKKLPEHLYRRISPATLGAWLPCQVALAFHLMCAHRKAGIQAHVINGSFSDFVNHALSKIGLSPTIGAGNVDLIATSIQLLLSRRFEVPMEDVSIHLVCHYAWWVYPREEGTRPGAPFFLRAHVSNRDVTADFESEQLLKEAVRLHPPGLDFTTASASSAIKNMFALLDCNELELFTHSPGPNGLPGGYPVKISKSGVTLSLPEILAVEEAIRINVESQKYIGVERITEEGAIVYMDYTHNTLKEVLGFEHRSFTPEQSYEVAVDLIGRFKTFSRS